MNIFVYQTPRDPEFLSKIKQGLEALGCFTEVNTNQSVRINCIAGTTSVFVIYSYGANQLANEIVIRDINGQVMDVDYSSVVSMDSSIYLYFTDHYVYLSMGARESNSNSHVLNTFVITKDKNNNPIILFAQSRDNAMRTGMSIYNIKQSKKETFAYSNNKWPSTHNEPFSVTTNYVILGDNGYEALTDVFFFWYAADNIPKQYDFTDKSSGTYDPPTELMVDGQLYITDGELLLKV